MRASVILLGIVALCHGSECTPPSPVVTRLFAKFRYQNGLGHNHPYDERFSLTHIGARYYLRQNTVPIHYDPNLRPVSVFEGDAEVSAAEGNCPPDPSWIDCAVYLSTQANAPSRVVYDGEKTLKYPPSGVAASECEFVLHVPRWEPSRDSPEKREMARQILGELRHFGYEDAKKIVIRDFNVQDPDITAYITDQSGRHLFQGCAFSRDLVPHCGWHMFGQSPLAGLRREVMTRPYVLYPPRRP